MPKTDTALAAGTDRRADDRQRVVTTAERHIASVPHLTTEWMVGGPSADRDNECYCLSCRARVTVDARGTRAEYGHGYECPHRPAIDRGYGGAP